MKSSSKNRSRLPHHKSRFQNILVLRGGAIGDFILTLPVFAALRKNFPSAQIEILGYPHIANLALSFPLDVGCSTDYSLSPRGTSGERVRVRGFVNAVHSIESPDLASFFAENTELSPKWTSYFSKFDLIISYLSDPEKTLQKNIKRSSAARFIALPHRPNEIESLHATEVFLKPLQQLGILQPDPTPQLPRVTCHSSPVTFLALHPGSGSEQKNWPEENWAALIDWLLKNVNSSLLLIGGEAEGEKLQRLARRIPPERLQLAQNLPLPELAQKLSAVNFFLGHDSGITHLAAALDLSGLILWGPSNFAVWHPRSAKMKILQSPEGLSRLPVETVIIAFESLRAAQSSFASNIPNAR